MKPLATSEISQVLKKLDQLYPDAHCELVHETPFQLLIATVLSAQCTDALVNKVTPSLFEKFPDPLKLSKARIQDVEKLIGSINYYRSKAKNIVMLSKQLCDEHNGDVPKTVEDLIKLPGVGRKTANVVLGNAFRIADGIVVDTHVKRVSTLLGWVTQLEPIKIEEELKKIIPQQKWIQISHQLIFHGRQVCKARKPNCFECQLSPYCLRIGL